VAAERDRERGRALAWGMRKIWLVVVLAGCENVHVNVECNTNNNNQIDCSVTEDKGKNEVETCFDVSAPCKNGSVVTAPRTCSKVKDGGTVKVTIAQDKLVNLDKCDGAQKMNITNLTLDGQKGE
jgi:hypothetical protein